MFAFTTKSGYMFRSPQDLVGIVQTDHTICEFESAFYREIDSNIVYATVSQSTSYGCQTSTHVRMIVNDELKATFLVDADIYYHCEFGEQSWHSKELTSEWLEALRLPYHQFYTSTPNKSLMVGQDDMLAWILTRRIFNNVLKNLDEHLNVLPNDIIELVKEYDLKNEGLDYMVDIGKKENETWPLIVQHINGFSRRPLYRVVTVKQSENQNEQNAWVNLPDTYLGDDEDEDVTLIMMNYVTLD